MNFFFFLNFKTIFLCVVYTEGGEMDVSRPHIRIRIHIRIRRTPPHTPLALMFFFFLENFYCVFIQISPQSQILLKFFSLKLPSHLHINELKITPTDFYDGSPSPTKRRLIDAKFIFKKISKNFKKNLNLICIRVTVNGRVVINEGTGNRTR